MQPHKLPPQEIKEMDVVDHLKGLGYHPQTIRGNDHWFLSPLHEERVPSFKVNRQLNCWYDHSLGRGGNLVDFLLLYHHCTAKELLQRMSNSLSFHQPKEPIISLPADGNNTVDPEIKMSTQNHLNLLTERAEKRGIQVTREMPLTNPFLLSYIRSRSIPVELAQKHLQEVHYELHSRPYYALGFKNDSGGFELRNKYFKGSSSPKDVTTISCRQNAGELSVFEGFFSFLSYLKVEEKNNLPLTNFLVLNSLSLFHKNIGKLEVFTKAHLYLDNDTAGNEVTARALQRGEKFTDERKLYTGYKDLNEWLIQQNQKRKQRHLLKP